MRGTNLGSSGTLPKTAELDLLTAQLMSVEEKLLWTVPPGLLSFSSVPGGENRTSLSTFPDCLANSSLLSLSNMPGSIRTSLDILWNQ